MSLIYSKPKQKNIDTEWLREFTLSNHNNNDERKYELVNKIFIDAYYDNLQEGMKPKDALEKAKWVAFCFLMQRN